jgi:hypothetical protein
MKVRDIVRTAILRTNPYWPFSNLNKVPYDLAVKAFVRLSKRFPQIKSVYLRHGLTEENWIPGLSDIDLALIIDSKLNMDEEFSFLNSFWKNHDRIKKLFPMIGEIEILNEEHIKSWRQFEMPGYRSLSWKLVYGIETRKNHVTVNPKQLGVDSVNYALRFYLGYFLDRFDPKEESPYLALQDLKRVFFKILRSLNQMNTDDGKEGTVPEAPNNKTDMLFLVLKGLEDGIRFITTSESDSNKTDKTWLADVDSRNNVLFENREFDIGASVSWDKAVQSIILNYDRRIFIILNDELDAPAMKRCIAAIRRVFAQEKKMPVIASSKLFKYMLRYYDPFEYTRLIGYRIVAYGKDVVSEIQPPKKSSFVSYLLRETPTTLTFPQSHTLISPPSSNWWSGRDLDVVLNKSLFLKLYLEKGVIRPWHNELLTECQKHYPELFMKWRALGDTRGETIGREWFRLLKGIANDVHSCLARPT